MTPDMPLSVLRGVSTARIKLFAKLDILTLRDLVSHYPRAYENRGDINKVSEVLFGETVSLLLEIAQPPTSNRIPARNGKRALSVQKLTAFDDSGYIQITFFNQNYLSDVFRPGRKFRFYGQIGGTVLNPSLTSPDYEAAEDEASLDRFVPVYALTAGITRKMLQNAVKQALHAFSDPKYDALPKHLRTDYHLCDYAFALQNIHFPSEWKEMQAARRRLAFEELYNFQYNLMTMGQKERQGNAVRFIYPDMRKFTNELPFSLTMAQKHAIQDILVDMTGVKKPQEKQKETPNTTAPARRLIQGDVGSGKTVVAAAAIYAASVNQRQSALMVPTSILAEQHYASLGPLLAKFGIRTALLTGATKSSEKKEILSLLSKGEIDCIIGTHALIEDTVVFRALSLVITDEQHRFGVKQREKLFLKSVENVEGGEEKPHMIVMSATPIPRTLAMILYGDLDISIIDELPPGRQKIDTFAVGEDMRPRIYEFLKKQVKEGRQAYIVCPLVEQKEDEYDPFGFGVDTDLKAASEHAEHLQKDVFREFNVALLHGKMKAAQKDEIMRGFSEGKFDILVATTVIEVGVNVPNAAVMLVENAERFGLSQLHQLRGRVGRGQHKSYCILLSPLLSGKSKDATFAKRLQIMCDTESGFKIAQSDLELRGPGEFFGKRQHGELRFQIADIAADMALLEETKKAVAEVLARGNEIRDFQKNDEGML